jgi:hypothetical protein
MQVVLGAASPAASLRKQHRRAEDLSDLPAGIWTTRGYGYALNVRSTAATGTITLLQESAISCVVENIEDSLDVIIDGDTATLDVGTNVPYVIDRTEAFQAGCANGITPVVGDPAYVRDAIVDFDILDQISLEHYAFFDLRGIDWEALTSKARANITST